MSDVPPLPPAGQPVQKKGLPPLAWFGIGCGGLLLVIGVVAIIVVAFAAKKISVAAKNPSKAVANLVVQANPDFEKVSENDETGEMTIRVKKTGEQMTLKYTELAEGRVLMTDPEGKDTSLFKGDLAAVPTWVPRFPTATEEKSVVQRNDPDQTTGVISFTTTSTDDEVATYFANAASLLGMNSSSSSSSDVGETTVFKLGYRGGKRELQVDGYSSDGKAFNVLTTYTEKK